jgi:hypothetical protein
METAGIKELRQSLSGLKQKELVEICTRLVKYKKENKEYVSYLLLFNEDEEGFIRAVKKEINEAFSGINDSNTYYLMKSGRKILKATNKYCRFSLKTETEVELLIHFTGQFLHRGKMANSLAAARFLERLIARIRKKIGLLHEDLQFDYQQVLDRTLGGAGNQSFS